MRIIGVVYAIYCFGPIILDLAIHCLSKSGDEVATSASLAVSIPAPTPQQFFPEIRLKTGTVLKAVSVVRKDADGFVVRAQGKIIKIYEGDLSADLLMALSAGVPAN